jgi:SAM-dependent methyltransferase
MTPSCRFCDAPLSEVFCDLGMSPPCESFLDASQIHRMEPFYPLVAYVCGRCFLVQLEEMVDPAEIFRDYAYFSSYSSSWVEHALRYAEEMIEVHGLGETSLVVEVASNDGYLLQHFVQRGVPCYGVDPAENVALEAQEKGVETLTEFFTLEKARELAEQRGKADLIAGNNVFAQVHAINDFVAGFAALLAEEGTLTLEFPHLLRLMEQNQYDTIYHEHYSYFSLATTQRILAAHGLRVYRVDELPSHGGSLRVHACLEASAHPAHASLEQVLESERAAGLDGLAAYHDFQERVHAQKRDLLEFLIGARRAGKRVVGYGAPGKGNTLLNYCGIRGDLLEFTVDRNPHKHGKFLPGTHIPIHAPEAIAQARPDYLLILPWNLKKEIMQQNAFIREWGGRFVVPIPKVEVLD